MEGEGEFSLGSIDALKQFLAVSAEGAGCGPTDPVFVDHEDSQHATTMDSLVFEAAGEGREGGDDMMEPRLDSVCNSNIHSAEGSLVLGSPAEEGELASSPEPPGATQAEGGTTGYKKKFTMSEDECDNDVEKRKKVKKKKMKKCKQEEEDKSEDLAQSKRQKPKKFKSSSASVEASQAKHSKPSVPPAPASAPSLPNSRPNPSTTPPPSAPSTPPPPTTPNTPPCTAPPLPLSTPPLAAPPPSLPPSTQEGGRAEAPAGQPKARRISLQDYKAKKEAEKKRRSQEGAGSGSESSSGPASQAASKEPSPSPEPAKAKEASVETKVVKKEDVVAVEEAAAQVSEEMDTTVESGEQLEAVSDSELEAGEPLQLQDFDILDELEESGEETSKDSGEDSDSLAEDEVDQMLEEKVPAESMEVEDIEPQEKLTKLVLEERGGNLFEVLPLGWVAVTHNSGIPLYLHRDSRVVTASRPYDLGNGSVRKHNLPVSAIPCLAYRYVSPSAPTPSPAPASCPYSAPPFARENVSPDSTTDGAAPAPAPAEGAEVTNVFPRAQIDTIEETMKKSELTPEEITSYCKKIFVFKELEVAKFKTWKERRAYYKQSQKKKIDNLLSNRPTLPEGTKIITIPSLEMSTIPGTEGDSAINQKVVKKSKKKWLMNPVGKSMVCLLHEYVQQSLKMQPYYTFTELDNAATPYAAIVHINKIEYGRGTGSSKKIAKSEAAK